MIALQFDTEANVNSDKRLQLEWLDTNGIGGWSSSTISGCNTRRYHGLLVAATNPPTERHVMLSKLDETFVTQDRRVEMGTNNYGNVTHPNGWKHIRSFSRVLYPQFIYAAEEIELRKSVVMLHGHNTVLIKYEVLKVPALFTLELTPFVAARGYHELNKAFSTTFDTTWQNEVLRVRPENQLPALSIVVDHAEFVSQPDWYYNFHYSVEQERGLDYTEDLFTPGKILRTCREGDIFYACITTEPDIIRNCAERFDQEVERRKQLVGIESNPATRQLLLSADQFIVKRSSGPAETESEGATIIAGYHWFTDWGRDTMIALPGLCLTTQRFNDARKILLAFSQAVNLGMLPNRFQDNGGLPEYNNVDGTLQYFIAIHEYLLATNDTKFVLGSLLPVLKEIIEWHFKGTRYNIHVDEDGLLYAGEKGYQLTWMDARIGDWVVTPRAGKPVEIQALWYNALKIFAALLELNGETDFSREITERAEQLKKSFDEKFWFNEGEYLFDLIDENGSADKSIRPNQLFAISLPHALIDGEKAKKVFEAVDRHLYTPRGLRSLSPADEKYIGSYGGDPWHRDSSYHQGTVWSWLIGPFIDALYKCHESSAANSKANEVIQALLEHLFEAGLGTVSEIFDGNAPHKPNGCIAQAWSVGELLRVIKKYQPGSLEKNILHTDHSLFAIK
jgi:predicted glycogen debranching enzyme